jgi:hypothetical protein
MAMKRGNKWILLAVSLTMFSSTQAADVEDRLQVLERELGELRQKQQTTAAASSQLPTKKGMTIELGGEMEIEYVDTEDGTSVATPSSHFKMDKFTLTPRVHFGEDMRLEALLLFKSTTARVDELYLIASDLPADSELQVGMNDRIWNEWPSRRSEGFPLIDSAFARDDEMGITWRRKAKEGLSWYLSLTNGYALGEIQPSEDSSYKLLHDNRQTSDSNDNKALGAGLGWASGKGDYGSLALLAFGALGELSSDDIQVLQGIAGYGSSSSDTNERAGAALKYERGALNVGAKYITARDGELDRDGWFAQAGYRFTLPANGFAESIEPFVRYGELNVDLPAAATNPLTWDRRQTTVAALLGIRKGVMVKVEHYTNDEESGGLVVDNNEYLVQLEMKF